MSKSVTEELADVVRALCKEVEELVACIEDDKSFVGWVDPEHARVLEQARAALARYEAEKGKAFDVVDALRGAESAIDAFQVLANYRSIRRIALKHAGDER